MTYFRLNILLLLFLASNLFSQERIFLGGEINSQEFWRGTVRIQGDVIVTASGRLTIEPGTRVLFAANSDQTKSGTDKTRSEFIVRGTLIARGLPDSKIIFSSGADAPRMGDWYGIQFLHNKSENIIDYCVIEYAYNGLTIKNTSLSIANSEIRYNYNAGIRTEVKAKPVLRQNIISENGYAGVICELGAAPILTENLVSGNPMGIVIMSLSQPNLGSISRGENNNPGKNQFLNNEEYDIYNHSNKVILAQNNTWGSENTNEISARVYDRSDNSKYGSIQYEPIFNQQSRQSTLSRFMILAQNNEPPATAAPNPTNSLPEVSNVQSAETQDNSAEASENILQEIDSTMQENLASRNDMTTEPLIAATQISQAPLEVEDNRPANTIEQIDYERVFLEPFLDAGRKKVLQRADIRMNNALLEMMEPGVVRVKVIVNQQGRVESASILRGINEIVDEAVLDAVRLFQYEVGTVNSIPVRFSTNEVFRFK